MSGSKLYAICVFMRFRMKSFECTKDNKGFIYFLKGQYPLDVPGWNESKIPCNSDRMVEWTVSRPCVPHWRSKPIVITTGYSVVLCIILILSGHYSSEDGRLLRSAHLCIILFDHRAE